MKNKLLKLTLAITLATTGILSSQTTNPAPYCASGFDNDYNMVQSISVMGTNFSLGAMGSFGAPHSYTFYTNATFPNLIVNGSSTISIGFYSVQDAEPRYFALWIDYNSNNTFDPNEVIMQNANTTNTNLPTFTQSSVTITKTFTIPLGTTPGVKRMRLVRSENATGNGATLYGAYTSTFTAAPCQIAVPMTGNTYGCTYDFSVNITAGGPAPVPVPQFSANITNTTVNSTISFADQSTNAPTSWKWRISPSTYSFASATSSLSQNPQITFTATGMYTIKLRVSNTAGADSLTKTSYITITSGTTALGPVTQFSASITTTLVNSTINFSDQTANSPTSWKWTITPSTYSFVNATTNTSQNPQVKFAAVGTYTVKLRTANNIKADSLTKTSYIKIIGSVGIQELNETKQNILVFPNPVKDIITISQDNLEIKQAEILDNLGRTVYVFNRNTADISALPDGIYFIKIKNSTNEIIYKKIIKE